MVKILGIGYWPADEGLLLRLAAQLPPPARRFATPARIAMLVQFLMFGTVGLVGFAFDTATVYSLRRSFGLYGAGMAGIRPWPLPSPGC